MIDWEKLARAETHPTRIRVLEAVDELGEGAYISPSEIGPQLGIGSELRRKAGVELVERCQSLGAQELAA